MKSVDLSERSLKSFELQLSSNLRVAGSNPAGVTNKINRLGFTGGHSDKRIARRDQIEQVADRIDCAKLTKSGSAGSISPPCTYAAELICEMSLTHSSGSLFDPAAAHHGGAGRRIVADVEEIVARKCLRPRR